MIAFKSMWNKLVHTMSRKKSGHKGPLPPRSGLGATRIRVPDGDLVTAGTLVTQVVFSQHHRHPSDDESAIAERFAAGEVVLRNGTILTPEDLVAPGEDVFFYKRPASEKPVPYEIETVFEDDDIMVVNKPPFLATMPRAAHITETVTVRMRRSTGNEELTPAHRLDRMTSGLLLLTKRREVRGAYQQLFATRQVHKVYEAIAPLRDIVAPTQWAHHITKTHGEIAAKLSDEAPNSFTNLQLIEPVDASQFAMHGEDGPLGRYILEPITGKTHQLRIQMLDAGAPILGDPVYPTVKAFDDEDFAVPMRLASVELRFDDPLSGRPRLFRALGHSTLALPD
ncbi:pseudouridine synthase [Corynebacterium lubricantis]|uniref:pseudouridine synthase n=1 Tax=Corynebacterium lubricantis TaxID=541095 RepID=UPI00036F7F5A